MLNFKNLFNDNSSPIGLKSMGLSAQKIDKTPSETPSLKLFTNTTSANTDNTIKLSFTPRNVGEELNTLFSNNKNTFIG